MADNETTPLLIDEREAARRLHVSPRTLWTLRRTGRIGVTQVGRLVRYTTADLTQFIEKHQRGPQRAASSHDNVEVQDG